MQGWLEIYKCLPADGIGDHCTDNTSVSCNGYSGMILGEDNHNLRDIL